MTEFTLIEAANGAKPKVMGTAYSGGKMNLPGWKHPVVKKIIRNVVFNPLIRIRIVLLWIKIL